MRLQLIRLSVFLLFFTKLIGGYGQTVIFTSPNAATDPGTIANTTTARLEKIIVTPYQLRLSVALQKFYRPC